MPAEMIDFDAVTEALSTVFTELGATVYSGDWTSAPLGLQQQLRAAVNSLNELNSNVRPVFDQTVYVGHPSGAVLTEIAPIRAKSEFKNGQPGRVAQTLEQKLAAKLAAIVG